MSTVARPLHRIRVWAPIRALLGLAALFAALAPAGVRPAAAGYPNPRGMAVVPHLDLARYLGTWYEIAAIPQFFEKGCTGTKAEYSLRPDGDIRVLNSCHKGSLDGELSQAEGKAWVVDKETNARLKVSFFWPFSGNYWVIQLGPDYEYAVVGEPSRDYLWILSRSPTMDESQYKAILMGIENVGYDVGRLERTLQPAP
jgi:apolipoprotein D and lipocalin family protein